MNLFKKCSSSFWSEEFWLPYNVTWKDVEPGSKADIKYTDYKDILWSFPLAICILILRYFIERFLLTPIGKTLGVKTTSPNPPVYNQLLEKAYKRSSKLNPELNTSLRKQTDLTERQIQKWFRKRKAQDSLTTLDKFCEDGWRCIYSTFSVIFVLMLMWNKTWPLDVKQCWINVPHQSFDEGMRWCSIISMGFYVSLAISQFFDNKRKDFWLMFVHHFLTMAFISFSWVTNLHRVGSLILLVHECGIIPLSLMKCSKYANRQGICDVFYIIFTVVWIVSRLGFFPLIAYISTKEALRIAPIFHAYTIIHFTLYVLLTLHLMWTYIILKVMIRTIKAGKMERDIRSDSEDTDDLEN